MMKWVSRDPGVTQFYGACLVPETKDLMLVMELMEVCSTVLGFSMVLPAVSKGEQCLQYSWRGR